MLLLSFSKTVSSDPGCEIWASNFLCACKCSVWKKRERHKKQVLNSEWNSTSCTSHWSCDLWEASLNQSHHMNIHDNSRLVLCQITANHWCGLFCYANERLQCLSDELLFLIHFFHHALERVGYEKLLKYCLTTLNSCRNTSLCSESPANPVYNLLHETFSIKYEIPSQIGSTCAISR